ncbi:uncharacterized protein METZ01_LOCUS357491, partial [marine metagenome]
VSLREQITADMKEAMRARDTARLEAVRLLRAAIQRREVDEQIELTDDEVLSVIQKMIKQGRDSIEQFEKGDRQDLVEKETAMLTVLEPYLPDTLSEKDLTALIAEALIDTNAESMRDMGQVMGWLKPKLQGKADMAAVSAAVQEQLNR